MHRAEAGQALRADEAAGDVDAGGATATATTTAHEGWPTSGATRGSRRPRAPASPVMSGSGFPAVTGMRASSSRSPMMVATTKTTAGGMAAANPPSPKPHRRVALTAPMTPAAWAMTAAVAWRRWTVAYTRPSSRKLPVNSRAGTATGSPARRVTTPRALHTGPAHAHRVRTATVRSRPMAPPTKPKIASGPWSAASVAARVPPRYPSRASAAVRPVRTETPAKARNTNRCHTTG